MRVSIIVNDHGTAQTIAVLSRQMAVVPEGASLTWRVEVVQERVPGRDRALVNERRSVSPVGAFLEEAVPVLRNRLRSETRC